MMSLFWGEGRKKTANGGGHELGRRAVVRCCTYRVWCCLLYAAISFRETHIFARDGGRAYLPVTFLIAKTIEECVIILPFALIYFAAVFFSVGLQGNFFVSFGLFYLTVIA